MEKIINISGKEVKLKSTAGTLLRYRNYFHRDFMKDLIHLQRRLNEKEENGTDFEIIDLELFERIAWCMAKTADKDTPDIESWLDGFESFDIMIVLPEIMTLLTDNMSQLSNSKKNLNEVTK